MSSSSFVQFGFASDARHFELCGFSWQAPQHQPKTRGCLDSTALVFVKVYKKSNVIDLNGFMKETQCFFPIFIAIWSFFPYGLIMFQIKLPYSVDFHYLQAQRELNYQQMLIQTLHLHQC